MSRDYTFDFRRASVHVAAVPDARGEGVCVADENFVCAPRGLVLQLALSRGDVRELIRAEVVAALFGELALGILAPVLVHPDRPVMPCERRGERSLAG